MIIGCANRLLSSTVNRLGDHAIFTTIAPAVWELFAQSLFEKQKPDKYESDRLAHSGFRIIKTKEVNFF